MPVTRAKWMRNPDGAEPTTLEAVIDDQTVFVPADPANRHYAEIMAAQDAGDVTIEDADPEPAPDPYAPLSPRQFDWMLAYYGWEDVWSSMKGANKGSNQGLYANLRANEKAQSYFIEDTLAFIGQVRDLPAIKNSGVDLSDEAIRAGWRHASVQTFDSLTDVVPAPT